MPAFWYGLAVSTSLAAATTTLLLLRPHPAWAGSPFVLRNPVGPVGGGGGGRPVHLLRGPQGQLRLPVLPEEGIVEVGIGRAPDRDRDHLVLSDATVSRRHAVLRGEAGIWEVFGVAPSNPVRLNGRTVGPDGEVLKDGDEIGLGRLWIRFVLEEGG